MQSAHRDDLPDEEDGDAGEFHMWFPGGIVIGGLIAYGITQAFPDGMIGALATWQAKLLVILVPTVIYGILFTGQKFPHTERVQSGVTFGGMLKECCTRPIFIVLLLCMIITASLELGPNRWLPAVLGAGGIAGILVLCYINGLMAILRFFAGPVVHKLSNTGVLLAVGLAGGAGAARAVLRNHHGDGFRHGDGICGGVCYFWPTMLGTCAERVPKGRRAGAGVAGRNGNAVRGRNHFA